MTTNNTPPNALENDLPEDGELTLEELEQIIGGQADPSLNLNG
jgi:bacteriocin-like protein